MKFKKTKIADKVYLLTFRTQRELASTFLRFQEYYESPKFKWKIFTIKEYKKWYSKLKAGKFTYYTDWAGFNIPSCVLKPFYEGKFNPLSKKEKQLLNSFKKERSEFYIIGINLNTKGKKLTKEQVNLDIKHELAHGLFYTNKKYRDEVLKTLKKFNLKKIKEKIRGYKGGYCEDVLNDEAHAFTLEGRNFSRVSAKLCKKLERVYKKYTKKSKPSV